MPPSNAGAALSVSSSVVKLSVSAIHERRPSESESVEARKAYAPNASPHPPARTRGGVERAAGSFRPTFPTRLPALGREGPAILSAARSHYPVIAECDAMAEARPRGRRRCFPRFPVGAPSPSRPVPS
jgi:hypothetical protein